MEISGERGRAEEREVHEEVSSVCEVLAGRWPPYLLSQCAVLDSQYSTTWDITFLQHGSSLFTISTHQNLCPACVEVERQPQTHASDIGPGEYARHFL